MKVRSIDGTRLVSIRSQTTSMIPTKDYDICTITYPLMLNDRQTLESMLEENLYVKMGGLDEFEAVICNCVDYNYGRCRVELRRI